MFKVIDVTTKCPDDCMVVCKVWEFESVVGKIICKYENIGRDTGVPSMSNKVAINKLLKVNGKQCPFCKKKLSCKSATKRHIENACPHMKVEQLEQDNVEIQSGFRHEIELPSHQYIKNASPNTKLRDIIDVAGAQGAGKSTWCKNYMSDFVEIMPDKLMVLMSRVEDDKAFREFIKDGKMIPLDINDPELIENPIDAKKELANTLCVFDDFYLYDKDIQESLRYTLNDIMLNCRDQADYGDDIYCLVTGHQIMDYKKTRDLLNEASTIVMFPKAGQHYHITRCMKVYIGLSKEQINKAMNLNTRWVACHKRFPNYILHEGGCYQV